MTTRTHILILTISVCQCSASSAAVKYVKVGGAGACTSWADACSLTTAVAQADATTADQVWVQAGTYTPPLALKNGVKVIGGFAGTETQVSQSNPAANLTVIDGGHNTQCVTNLNDNLGGLPAYLRGFTIRNGKESDGGGLLLQNSNALVVQCIFQDNTGDFGGAVIIRGVGSPQFVSCTFRNNGLSAPSASNTYGGGAVFIRDFATPLFANCLFENNKAEQGGAILVGEGYPTFINCTFVNNQVTTTRGGAIADFEGGVTLKNSILWNNTRDPDGAGPQPPVPDQIHNAGGTTIATYCDIQGGWPSGSGILNLDPLFQGSFYLVADDSPVKNAGDGVLPADAVDLDWDNNTTEPIPKDLGLLPRVRGGVIDLGAHEIFALGGGGGE